MGTTHTLAFAVLHKHMLFGPRKELLTHQCIKKQTYKSRFNTEIKQDGYSAARPTQKCGSNRNPTVEPQPNSFSIQNLPTQSASYSTGFSNSDASVVCMALHRVLTWLNCERLLSFHRSANMINCNMVYLSLFWHMHYKVMLHEMHKINFHSSGC